MQTIGAKPVPLGKTLTAKRAKRPRTVRAASAAPLVLTERDLDVLTLTGLCRYLSTNQLGREFFPSLDRARRRLRGLFDAGYLVITLASSTLPNLISLTRKGLATVQAARSEIAERLGLAGTIRVMGIRHHLGVVDVRLFAAALGMKRGEPLLRWSNAGSPRMKAFGFDTARLSPDGLAEFRVSGGSITVAVEVDLGTEAQPILARKWRKYRQVASAGSVDALWVYVDAGAGRRAGVVEQLAAHGLADWTRVLGEEVVRRPVAELVRRAEGPNTGLAASEEAAANQEPIASGGAADGTVDRRADGRG